MMYEIIPTRALHIKPMAAKLRTAHSLGLLRYGLDPRASLHRAVRQSSFCRTAIIDGQPVAMWGLQAPLLAETAIVWLAMSDGVTRFRKTIVEEARRQLLEMGHHYGQFFTTVLPADEASISFAVFLGFHDNHDEGSASMSRREKIAELLQNPRHRVAFGDDYVIALGWHGAA